MAENDGSVKIAIDVDDDGAAKKLKKVGDEAENLGENAEDAADGLKKTEKGLDGVGDSSEDAKKGIGVLDIAVGNFVSSGLTALVGGVLDAAKSLIALAEETKEYRNDMAKLQTAFKSTGKSVDAAEKSYQDFYAILGESDRSVEAVNHLAELTNNTEELSQWTTIAAGVTAKFGDSLPIEGLTEAANETAKVGQVTGVLADALNWAGVSEDAFNEKLAACTTEQERSALITSTLNGLYSEAAAEYNELTASTQAANRATAELQAQQAAVGAVVEPLTTLWTNFKANALEASLPALTWVSEGLQGIAAKAGEAARGTDLLSESQRASLTAAEAAAESFRKTGEAAAQLASVQITNVDYVANNLLPQLQSLVNANGEVEESDRARAQFILEQLNQALGTEYESLQQIIDANGQVRDSVYEVIEAKKAQILLTAYEEAYTEAINGVIEAQNRRALAAKELALQEAKFAEVEAEMQRLRDELTEAALRNDQEKIRSLGLHMTQYETTVNKEKRLLEEKQQAYDDSEADLSLYYQTIDGYELASTAVMAGETEKALGYLTRLSEGFMTAEEARAEAKKQGMHTMEEQTEFMAAELGEQAELAASHLQWLVDEYEKNQSSMTKEQKEQAEARIKQAQKEAKSALEEFEKVGANITKGMGAGAENEESKFGTLSKKVKGLVGKAIKAAQEALDSHSPSRVFEKIFYSVPQGAAKGVLLHVDDVIEAVDTMSDAAAETASEGVEEIVDVIEDKKPDFEEAGTALMDAMNDAIKSGSTEQKKTIEQMMSDFVTLSRNYEQQVADIWAKLDDDIASARDSYNSQLNSTAKSIAGSFGLFDYVEDTEVVNEDNFLTTNLQSQVDRLAEYNRLIDGLRNRGLNREFMDELTQLGVDATAELYALYDMTDEELSFYVDLWQEKSRLAREAAEEELKTLKDETEETIEELKKTADDKYAEIKEEYEQNAIELADNIRAAMVESGDAGYTALIEKLTDYVDAGKSLMTSVGEGVDAETPALLAKFEGIADAAEDIIGGAIASIQATVAGEQAKLTGGVQVQHADDATNAAAALGALASTLVNTPYRYNNVAGSPTTVVLEVDKRVLGQVVLETGTAEGERLGVNNILR